MPIKAEDGRTLRVYNPEEKANNAKKKNERDLAISQSYFDQAPSVQNIIRGIYHWARGSEWSPFSRSEDPDDYKYNAGTIPIVVAPARVAGAVVQSIPRWLNPKAVATTAAIGTAASQVSNRPRVMPISRSVSMASEATDDSATPQDSAQSATGTTQSTQPQQKPEDKKPEQDPKKSPGQEIKESAKRNLDRIKRGYTKMGKGLVNTALYAIGSSPITVPVGMWVYNAITDDENKEQLSPADSTRISLTKQYEELQKEQENKRLKAKIDSINSTGQNPQQISPEDSVRNAALKRYLDDIQHGKN